MNVKFHLDDEIQRLSDILGLVLNTAHNLKEQIRTFTQLKFYKE